MNPNHQISRQLLFLIGIALLIVSFAGADNLLPETSQQSGDYGYYQVTSSPAGADVSFDGTYVGEAPLTVPVFSSVSQGHTISVSKTGYITWTQVYPQNPRPGETVQVLASLQPSESTGSIRVLSSPGGALVSLDGSMGQMAPWTYTGVPVGPHIVQAFLSGFSPFSGQVDVVAGQVTEVYATLVPLYSTGALQVTTNPGGADLYVDAVYQGKTSTTVGNLATGKHSILVRLYGYQELIGDVAIEQGKTTYLALTLIQNTEPTTGNIRVSSVPSGAGIFLDTVYQGVTYPGSPTTLTGISPGSHTVDLTLSGFQKYSGTVKIIAGETADFSATLLPNPPPSINASIDVSSEPTGASVFVDGELKGITPLTRLPVFPGNHSVLLQMPGFNDYSTKINLDSGQSAIISAALAPQATVVPERTQAPVAGFLPILGTGLVFMVVFRKR